MVSSPAPNRFPVLIVEDNVVNRLVLKKQLIRLGFTIYEANHGEEALAFLQTTRLYAGNEQSGKDLALVLMDWEMPVMDGLTCVRHIRAMQAEGQLRGDIPIIGCTANARKEQIETAMEAGMVSLSCFYHPRSTHANTRDQDSVVSKPFRVPELVKQMEELVGRVPET